MDNQPTKEQLDKIMAENEQKKNNVKSFEFNQLELSVVLNTLVRQQFSLGVAEVLLPFIHKIEPFVIAESNIKDNHIVTNITDKPKGKN